MPDSQPKPFQFSMFNLMLAMVPLAVVCACIGYENRFGRNLWTAVVIVFGLTAAGGTLAGGWRGMFRAVGVGVGATLAGVAIVVSVAMFLYLVFLMGR
jgi:hypothetical protein